MKAKQRASPLAYHAVASSDDDDDDNRPLATYLDRGRGRGRNYSRSRAKHNENQVLIDKVTNAWRSDKTTGSGYSSSDDDFGDEITHCCDLDSETSCVGVVAAALKNRRIRRSLILVLLLTFIVYYGYYHQLKPGWDLERLKLESFNQPLGAFGIQDWNKFEDTMQIHELASQHIPGGDHDPEGKRRLIFVGDIHGCKDELLDLLQKVGFSQHTDYLICTGDVVSKGPDSLGVVDHLISINATSVRGNHEDKVIVWADSMPESAEMDREERKSLAANTKGQDLARYLEPHHLAWMRALPLIIHIPAIKPPVSATAPTLQPDLEFEHSDNDDDDDDDDDTLPSGERSGNDYDKNKAKRSKDKKKNNKKKPTKPIPDILTDINVVHGGMVPGIPLRRQDPYSVMNMRSMSASSHVPSRERDKGVPWEKIWNWYNDRLSKHLATKSWSWFEEDYEVVSPSAASEQGQVDQDSGHGVAQTDDGRGGWFSWLGKLFGGGSGSGHDPQGLKLKLEPPSVIVYGHDSPRGLNMHDWTKGLDTGCVRGGKLTAMVVDAWGRAYLVQTKCKNRL